MKKPLILLHGAIGAGAQFLPWIPALEADFEVHTLDFEGHGSRMADRPFRIAHFAENVVAFLDEKGFAQADIFGYSMGGYVALYLASIQPERVGRIFTFATKLAWNPETAAKEAKMLNPETIEAKVPAFANVLAARHTGMGWKAHLAATAEMMLHLGQTPTLTPDLLAGLPHPIQMGLGDRDTMVTLSETVDAYRQLPNGRLLVLPGTPHPIEKIPFGSLHWHIRAFFMG